MEGRDEKDTSSDGGVKSIFGNPLRAHNLFEQLGYDQPRRSRADAHSPETEEREQFAAEALTRSPDRMKILEPLKVVFLFQPAFDSEFSQDRHHLSDRNPRQFRSPAERGFSLLVPLNRTQNSSAGHHVPNSFG